MFAAVWSTLSFSVVDNVLHRSSSRSDTTSMLLAIVTPSLLAFLTDIVEGEKKNTPNTIYYASGDIISEVEGEDEDIRMTDK